MSEQPQAASSVPPGWAERDGALHISYETGDFVTGLRLVNKIGEAAEAAGHHPDITLTYPEVAIRLLSHDVDAVTDRDTQLATRISEIAAELGIDRA